MKNFIYNTFKDGTIEMYNPLVDKVVLVVPNREVRPSDSSRQKKEKKLIGNKHHLYCDFCKDRLYKTTPEKARYLSNFLLENLPFSKIFKYDYEFRVISNLFEIIPYSYWQKNYDYQISESDLMQLNNYISEEKGYKHIKKVLNYRLSKIGKSIFNLSKDEILKLAEQFFAGCHELILYHKHFIDNARFSNELFSPVYLEEFEHKNLAKLTMQRVDKIYNKNPYVNFVSVFQNYLEPSGSSFDHFHRQVLGIDILGKRLSNLLEISSNDNNFIDSYLDYLRDNDLIIAENKNAIAVSEIGYNYPTIGIYCKNFKEYLNSINDEILNDFTELTHHIYKQISPYTSFNEKWYYTPKKKNLETFSKMKYSFSKLNFHSQISLRINRVAGFELNSGIYMNPISPQKLKSFFI